MQARVVQSSSTRTGERENIKIGWKYVYGIAEEPTVRWYLMPLTFKIVHRKLYPFAVRWRLTTSLHPRIQRDHW